MDEKQLAKLATMFKAEAKDHLAAINRDLLAIERGQVGGDRQALLEEEGGEKEAMWEGDFREGYENSKQEEKDIDSLFESLL